MLFVLYTMCVCVHRLTYVFRQRWEFIDMFTGVLAAGHAEAELEVKTLEQLLSEIVPLNHPEILYRPISDCELNAGRKKTQSARVCSVFCSPCPC